MVYAIRPHANNLNRMVELDYRTPPTAQRSWLDYLRKEETAPREAAPTLILSEHRAPLPDAFELSSDVWCVSDRAKDLMQSLFGAQAAFYEVPVVVEADNSPLPSTNIVSFSQFRTFIDWQKSKLKLAMPSRLFPNAETIRLADALDSAVFKAMPRDHEMIWVERTFREGDRLYSPGFNVYTTDTAARAIGDAFPEILILRKQREGQ